MPIHHLDIFNKVRQFYINFQNTDIYMRDLDLPSVLQELEKMFISGYLDNVWPPPKEHLEPNWSLLLNASSGEKLIRSIKDVNTWDL